MNGIEATCNAQYTATAIASGPGRGGIAKSDDEEGPLELQLSMPKTPGGKGDGHNPEQLLALGYSGKYARLIFALHFF